MRVSEIADAIGDDVRIIGDEGTEVSDISMDSRKVGPDHVFACIAGSNSDGHEFAQTAIERGAVALIVQRELDIDVPQIVVDSVRGSLSKASSAVYGRPQDELSVIGITGTNGKTTTSYMLQTILEAAGIKTELIGTITGVRTTPEAPDLFKSFRQFVDAGVSHVVMEVSSHALAQSRTDEILFDLAVFTNLSQDHLDFHGTMEEYFAAKRMLFTKECSEKAVINRDDEYGQMIIEAAEIPTESFGLSDATISKLDLSGAEFEWNSTKIHLHIPATHNIYNALAAATAAEAIGVSPSDITKGLDALTGVPGRLEPISEGQNFHVFVDYAHTPDGLERLLSSLKHDKSADSKLICVFGCGGDRDRGKRPLMGAAAEKYCDQVFLTSDNPRSENPSRILDEVLAGFDRQDSVVVEIDRRTAIAMALKAATFNDVVVIAGKGHELGQDIGGIVIPFDDREIAREELRELIGVVA